MGEINKKGNRHSISEKIQAERTRKNTIISLTHVPERWMNELCQLKKKRRLVKE